MALRLPLGVGPFFRFRRVYDKEPLQKINGPVCLQVLVSSPGGYKSSALEVPGVTKAVHMEKSLILKKDFSGVEILEIHAPDRGNAHQWHQTGRAGVSVHWRCSFWTCSLATHEV